MITIITYMQVWALLSCSELLSEDEWVLWSIQLGFGLGLISVVKLA